MCDVYPGNDGELLRPEYKLAQLMATEMQIPAIDPVRFKLFIQLHWKEVARLAHKIHDGGPK